MSQTAYAFRTATAADLDLIGRWLGERHVAKWWGKRDGALEEIAAHLAGDEVTATVVELGGTPIGYLQSYPASIATDFPPQPGGTLGIDFFIGDTSALGKAHGAGFINQFADAATADGVPRLVADPDGRNISAVGCLGRAGFSPVELIGPASARRLLMARDLISTSPQRGRRSR